MKSKKRLKQNNMKIKDFWDLPKLAVRMKDEDLSQKIDSIVYPYKNHKRS